MSFDDSTLFDPYGRIDEPMHWRRMLLLAFVLTVATIGIGLLAGG